MSPKRKPTVIFLRDKAYRVRVPTGLSGADDSLSEWDTVLSKVGSSDESFHWSYIWSWCQEPFLHPDHPEPSVKNLVPPPHRVLRGCTTARFLTTALCSTRGSYIGYRPVLEPVLPDTLEPDPSRWANTHDGEIIPLGTLYMNDKPIPLPQCPTEVGDIKDYIPGAILRIGKTHVDPNYQIRMIKCGSLLISDRNLLKNISWSDLDRCGLIYGETPRVRVPKLSNLSPSLFSSRRKSPFSSPADPSVG